MHRECGLNHLSLSLHAVRQGWRKTSCMAVMSCIITCIVASWTLSIKDHWSPNIWDGAEVGGRSARSL